MLLVFTVNKQITIVYQYNYNYWELNLLNLIKKKVFGIIKYMKQYSSVEIGFFSEIIMLLSTA